VDIEKRDRLSSLFWLVISIIVCIASIRLSVGTLRQPGSGFFPFLGGAILGLLSFIYLLTTFKSKRVLEKSEDVSSKINWLNIILTLAILFAFPLLLDLIGFAPTTFIFFAFLFRFIEPQRWFIVLGGAGGAAVFCYFFFQFWLGIKFPIGILGI